MTEVKNFYNNWSQKAGANNLQYLGNFNDNHDNARFLSGGVNQQTVFERFLSAEVNEDNKYKQFKSFTAFTLTSGIQL